MTPRRWARLAIGVGLLASLAGNAMAAEPTLLGRTVAAFAPLALALAVVLLEHGQAPAGPWRAATWLGAAVLATVAAWASYWHLAELVRTAGDSGPGTRYLLPLVPDALVLIGSAYLRQPAVRQELVLPGPPPMPPEPEPTPLEAPVPEIKVEAPNLEPARPGTKTELVRQLAAEHPDWTKAELAKAAGCDVRQVRRALNPKTAKPTLDDELAELFADPTTTGAHR